MTSSGNEISGKPAAPSGGGILASDTVEVPCRDLPALIARLRASGRRASTITAIGTSGYRVTVAAANESAGGATVSEHRFSTAEALAGLCRRLEPQGARIASLRTNGAAGFSVSVLEHRVT